MGLRRSTSSHRRRKCKTVSVMRKLDVQHHKKATSTGMAHQQLLHGLYKITKGSTFTASTVQAWLSQSGGRKTSVSMREAQKLLHGVCAAHVSKFNQPQSSRWRGEGIRYVKEHGNASVDNVEGFQEKPRRGTARNVIWHELGNRYTIGPQGSDHFQITQTAGKKVLGASIRRQDIADFKNTIVLDTFEVGAPTSAPQLTFIFLHSFSLRGLDYAKFPHYFGVSGANLRVILPTAPKQEQTCFEDWNVWRGDKLGWRRIKFHSWFDYLTDTGGSRENSLGLNSLVDMRTRLHNLIRTEVRRLGGDSKRVLIGGMSQGACVAMDAAMTYPDELGGVVGVVGHLMGCTPLDLKKRAMPLHLFFEKTDREMRWRWVQKTVERLVNHGFNVHQRRESDPMGGGHWIHDIEGQWITDGIREILVARGFSS